MTDAEILELRSKDQYDFMEYPKAVYRDRPKGWKAPREGAWVEPAPFETMNVNSAEEEQAALADGYRLTAEKEKAAA
jgi:hypothetical protein